MIKKAPIVSFFVRHGTASNLLMVTMILAGLFALMRLNIQFFPSIEVPAVTVSVAWPGASAADVERNILEPLEPALRFIDGVEKMISQAQEGAATITLEFAPSADMQKAQSDVEQAVATVTTLPDDSLQPKITRRARYERVGNIAVTGPFSEKVIKDYAKKIRDGLLAAGIDKVDMVGVRDEEIWVQVRERDFRRLDLTPGEIAQKIRQETRDLPSGTLKGDIELQLRTLAERRELETLREIEVKSGTDGAKVRLGELARVEAAFDKDDAVGKAGGHFAVELQVRRALTADTLETMERMNAYLERIAPTLPAGLVVRQYAVRGESVTKRIGILIKNGLQGLILVLIILFIFLNARIAFWVAAGIPVALLATLAVMLLTGQTINMVSMFALIMMLGIIVDDAIVVGEEVASRQEAGMSRLEAAESGALRMLSPVLAATLTTMAAFAPMFLIRDRIGDILSAIPLVVLAVLIASLIECFLILPGHLRHGFGKIRREPNRYRQAFDKGFRRFREGPFGSFVRLTYNWRYVTVASAIMIFVLAIGFLQGGRVKFRFFPSPESERMTLSVQFAPGTPRAQMAEAMRKLDASVYEVEKKLTNGNGKLIVTTFTNLGGGRGSDNQAVLRVYLTPSEQRSIPTTVIRRHWRKALPELPGVERVAVTRFRHGPSGRDINVLLQDAPIDTLKQASLELQQRLATFPGLQAINDNLPYGKGEMILEVTPRGASLGFTAENVGRQLRDAFEGAIATRFARGDEEITVRVKRLQELRGEPALWQLYLKSPSGEAVPLTEVVKIRTKKGFSIIRRENGKRTVSVTADISRKAKDVTVMDVIDWLEREVMPELAAKYHLNYAYSGRDKERRKSFADLKIGVLLALAVIYIILAWVFENYAKPLAVMSIIPFGIVGAIFGHYLLGLNLTIISLIGLLGLSGILVNDSIILVSQAKERLKKGQSMAMAAIGASKDRLRAVILTSLTTIAGLLPLLFETSRQAQFLIPMAVTLVFGLLTATILVLVLVPAVLGIGADIASLLRAAFGRLRQLWATGATVSTASAARKGAIKAKSSLKQPPKKTTV